MTYLADGIIKLFDLMGHKILLLETSSYFGYINKSNVNFDHHKCLFGTLVMLKNIADELQFASMETFCNCKVFFVHAACIRIIQLLNLFWLLTIFSHLKIKEKACLLSPNDRFTSFGWKAYWLSGLTLMTGWNFYQY